MKNKTNPLKILIEAVDLDQMYLIQNLVEYSSMKVL